MIGSGGVLTTIEEPSLHSSEISYSTEATQFPEGKAIAGETPEVISVPEIIAATLIIRLNLKLFRLESDRKKSKFEC